MKAPSFAYGNICKAIVGPRYELSLAFVSPTTARTINRFARGKKYAPNVLSFPLSKISGEIIICPAVAKKQAKGYNLTPDAFIGKLFIHGLFHLKGMRHGSRMESEERRIARKFL